jgi:hypothetical protein
MSEISGVVVSGGFSEFRGTPIGLRHSRRRDIRHFESRHFVWRDY